MHRLLPLVLLLAGCTLVDQTTFAPSPEPAPAPVVAPPKIETRSPLLVIAGNATPNEYQKPLGDAVRAAERMKRVDYDVIGVAPVAGGTVALDEAGAHAAEVMRVIMGQAVPAARIHLGVQQDPALTTGEVRVYVR